MLALLLTLAAGSALAHSGAHLGSLLATVWHLLTEPDHLALLALGAAIGATGAVLLVRRAR